MCLLLMEVVQEFETWRNTKLYLNKTVVIGIDGRHGKIQATCTREDKGGTRASNTSSTRNEDSEGTLPEDGGDRVSILLVPGAMESSRIIHPH